MKKFFKSRGAGFYTSASAAVLSLVTLIVYLVYANKGGMQYFSVAAAVLLAASVVFFAAGCLYKHTERLAAVFQAVLVFAALLVFIYACYRYFTEVFYGGVNAAAFEIMNKWFLASIILFFISTVLSQIGVYMRQSRRAEAEAGENGNE